MKKFLMALTIIIAVFLASGCSESQRQAVGFRLPDGDAMRGEATFVRLQCQSCHTVEGVTLPAPTAAGPVAVVLGGEKSYVKTYGDLVTSIINPSHKLASGYVAEQVSVDGQSLMRNYNDEMRVAELIDLVAFLQSHYKVIPPNFRYRGYHYGL